VSIAIGDYSRDLRPAKAEFIDKILRGANPAESPIERPTKFEFLINLKTAKALGLTIPAAMLSLADELRGSKNPVSPLSKEVRKCGPGCS
jgi:putative tryptophan/tyrosine transport system substrate-binding protein